MNVMTEPEESPTRYMLPDQGDGVVDYSLNDHSPARYPTFNKKRKKSNKKNKNKKAKKEPGNSVHFHPTVTLKTIYTTLKNQIEDVDLKAHFHPRSFARRDHFSYMKNTPFSLKLWSRFYIFFNLPN